MFGPGGRRGDGPGRRPSPRSTRGSTRSPSRSSGRRGSPASTWSPARGPPPIQRPRAARGAGRGPDLPPVVPGRGPRPVRPGPHRLPAEPPPLLLGRPGRQRLPRRPAPGPEDYGRPGARARSRSRSAWSRPGPNPGAALLGFVITMVQRPAGRPPALRGALLRELYGDGGLRDPDPATRPTIKEAIAQRKPIAQYKPKGASAKAIKALADELLAADRRRTGTTGTPSGGRLNGQARRAAARTPAATSARVMGARGASRRCRHAAAADRRRRPPGSQGVARSKDAARSPSAEDRAATPTSRARSSTRRPWPAWPSRSGTGASSSRSGSAGTRAGGPTCIICGERRWRAAQLAGLPT